MFKTLSFILVAFVATAANAQAITLLSCSAPGFLYNNLDIVDDGVLLHFSTSGNSLGVEMDQIQQGQRILRVDFSIDKDKCDLSKMNENEIICSVRDLPLSLKVQTVGQKTIDEIIEPTRFVTVLLKKVSNDHSLTNIKLLVLESLGIENLVLSNGFNICQ